ncbi:unnamed protein product [Allacma fusca]|uniref:Alanine--glyoxylate aminotransferase 2, mitochondrial n=1 Tax=Allacma fusca TaxID=39272 RepID=A0A8J2PHY2_9HEXA|nr:unnamed protein product [Allacma fusca]
MRSTRVLRQALSVEELNKIRVANLHPSIRKGTHFKEPLVVKNAYMQYIYDTSGKRYLDLLGGIVTVSVGHCHPKVNDALFQQAKNLWHSANIHLNSPVHEYAAKLAATLPGDLKVVYPVNSGSEANDLAVLMARVVTGNFDIISLRNGYHGMSPITMGLTGHSTWKQTAPHYFGFHHTMLPDCYNGLWAGCRDSPVQPDRKCEGSNCTSTHCTSADKYVQQLQEIFMYTLPQKKVAGFFIESIQGVGGVVQYPKGYVKKAFELVRQNGGVCVSDEVQTGFGRTGDSFWHFQDHGVIPDIVTMAKGIANGFPMAAVVTTPKIAECLTGAAHFNTFGGNPMGCAVASAVLDVIQEEKLQEHCKTLGTYMIHELNKIREEVPIVGDVRGKGLMIGIEMVKSKETREALPADKMAEIFEDLKNGGLIVGRGGFFGNTFRLSPPMCIQKQDVDSALETIRQVFKKYA